MDDMDHIVYLAMRFHQQSVWKHTEFDIDKVIQTATQCIQNGVIFIGRDAFFVGLLQPAIFNPNLITALEVIWFAPTGGGHELRDLFEDWALDHGATSVQLTHPVNDKLQTQTERLVESGYAPLELSFIKALI